MDVKIHSRYSFQPPHQSRDTVPLIDSTGEAPIPRFFFCCEIFFEQMIDFIESAMKAPQGPVIEGKLPANGSTIEEVIYISNCQLVEMGWMGGDKEEG